MSSRQDFYVFRHGETLLNVQQRCQGSGMDYDLTPLGVEQAQKLCAKLADKNLQAVFSSPLIRAKHTAEIVTSAFNIPLIINPDLRECYYGIAEGKPMAEIERDYPQIAQARRSPDADNLKLHFPLGESLGATLNRVLQAFTEIAASPYTTAGIAIHGGTMGALLYHFKIKVESVPNCGTMHLIHENGNWRAEGLVF